MGTENAKNGGQVLKAGTAKIPAHSNGRTRNGVSSTNANFAKKIKQKWIHA
jgi:hypothetical protein